MRTADGQRDPAMRVLRDLRNDAGRVRRGRYIVEESELVRRALDLGAEVEAVVLLDAFARTPEGKALAERATAARADTVTASAGLIGKSLGAKPTPDALAIVHRAVVRLDSVYDGACPLLLLVERGENADNLGMLLRSADAAGARAVILAADTVDPFNRRTVRGSRGAVFALPLAVAGDTAVAIERARHRGLAVIATSARGEVEYTDADLSGPVLILVGNEHDGLAPATRAAADRVVRIPMLGKIRSLNIAVAGSVMLYEAVRQRGRGAMP